jgi:hypothetical protein
MRRTLNRFLSSAAIVLAGLSLAGCKQAAGEYCEVTSDCETGLMCIASGAGGYCSASEPPADAGVLADVGGSTTDVPLPSPDVAATDVVSTSDTITPDAPAPADAAADLGADATPDLARDTAPVTPDSSSQ